MAYRRRSSGEGTSKRDRRDSDLEEVFDFYEYEGDSDVEIADYEDDLSQRISATKTPVTSRVVAGRKRKSIIQNDSKRSTPKLVNKPPLNRTKINTPIRPTTTTTNLTKLKNERLSNKIDQICEYAEILMHCLLFKTNYYNKKTHFNKCLKYNVIVYKCKSEIVCEYISNCVECMRIVLCRLYGVENDCSMISQKVDHPKKNFSIGLAVLKDEEEESAQANLLLRRFTLQLESLDEGEGEEEAGADKDGLEMSELRTNSDDDEDDNENSKNDALTLDEEFCFRDSLLKCLYAKEIQYPKNFKWQIQMRTSSKTMKETSEKEDLFKLFAWRKCDNEEVTSVTTRTLNQFDKAKAASNLTMPLNKIAIKPIKTIRPFFIDETKIRVKNDFVFKLL